MADEQLFGQLAAQLGEHAVIWRTDLKEANVCFPYERSRR